MIKKAVEILRGGGIVAFPTETVYGLGGDAKNLAAIEKIFTVKERPASNPLIVHLAFYQEMADWASLVPPEAYVLAKAFWPGPLTLVLPKKDWVSPLLTAGQDTVALRVPAHPIALSLLEAFGGGIAAPSANKFTRVSPTTAEAVKEELGNKVDLILEGGQCRVGLESTIVDISKDEPTILRPGNVSALAIEQVLGVKVSYAQHAHHTVVPGMHKIHYAPVTATSLISTEHLNSKVIKNRLDEKQVAVISFRTQISGLGVKRWINMPQTPQDYAHDLYQVLRMLDREKFDLILIECVPDNEAWMAVADRIEKASSGHFLLEGIK